MASWIFLERCSGIRQMGEMSTLHCMLLGTLESVHFQKKLGAKRISWHGSLSLTLSWIWALRSAKVC